MNVDDKKPACSVVADDAKSECTGDDEREPVFGIPVKDWNLFRGYCRLLGFDADHLRQLYVEDPRRAIMAPEMEALMWALYERGLISLDLLDAYNHEQAMIASEDPRPCTPEEQADVDELMARAREVMKKSPDEIRAERAARRARRAPRLKLV